jgi:hypothetical protein
MRVPFSPVVPAVNARMEIATEPATIDVEFGTVSTHISFVVTFAPHPRLRLEAQVPACSAIRINDEVAITLTRTGQQFRAEVVEVRWSTEAENLVLHVPSDLTVGNDHARFQSMVFALPNFPNFLTGETIRDSEGQPWRQLMRLSADGWSITIEAVGDIAQRIQALRSEGGCAVTATGHIRREDGLDFTLMEAVGTS